MGIKIEEVQKTHRFNAGDKVVLKDFETFCKNRHINEETMDGYFVRFYKYMKSKEPLTISYFWDPGDLKYDYGDEDPRTGTVCNKFMYNIQTPRSKLYLFDDNELDPYIETDSED